jgi:iron complex transport system permease protein
MAVATPQRVALRSHGFVVVRLRWVGFSTRLHARAIWVTLVLLLATFVMFIWSLAVGDFPISVGDVFASMFGAGSDDAGFIVRTLRLPRALTGLLVGAAFGLSGAILQRLARNPLASPDVIGIDAGAAAAAVFVIVILSGSGTQVTLAALVGSLLTATAIYLLAFKRGVTGFRLILVGIGIAAMLTSVISYLLTRAEIYDVQQAEVWLTGSLNGRSWEHVRPLAIGLAVLLPASLVLAHHLRLLELGDDVARGLGARVDLGRGVLIFVAVILAAASTASAGPIIFVALVAPQIARRLVGGRSLALIPAATCGALLLLSSDLVARRVLAPTELPVGVITAIVGAPYLIYLLARANKIGSGG